MDEQNEKALELIEVSGSHEADPDSNYQEQIVLEQIQGLKQFTLHINLMLRKNYILMKRNAAGTIFKYLSPVLVCIILLFWQQFANNLTDFQILDPPIFDNPKLPKCTPSEFNSDCVTIGYGIIGPQEVWIDYVLNYVAKVNDLQIGKDMRLISRESPKHYMDMLTHNPNRTMIGIIFCTSSWPVYSDMLQIPCQFDEISDKQMIFYSIIYNWTLLYKTPYLQQISSSHPQDEYALRLKLSVDNALINFFQNTTIEISSRINGVDEDAKQYTSPKTFKDTLNLIWQQYPKIATRFFRGADVSSVYGAFYFYLPIMVQFILLLNDVLKEKVKRLRNGLTVMGMSHQAYWFSWMITSIIESSIMTIVQILSGIIFGFEFFSNTPFFVLFFFYFSFYMATQAIAYMLITLSSDLKVGYAIGYGFLLLSVVMQLFLANNMVLTFFFLDDSDFYMDMLRYTFSLYPAFHYSKIYGDIAQQSTKHYSLATSGWEDPVGYQYSDLFSEIQGQYTIPRTMSFSAPSTFESWIYLNLTTFLFLFFAWYFDHVLESVNENNELNGINQRYFYFFFHQNRGSADSALFFLTADYWKCKSRRPRKSSGQIHHIEHSDFNHKSLEFKDTIQEERERVLNNKLKKAPVKGIRISRLGKTYFQYPFGIKSAKDLVALKDVFFEADDNELIAILGHNGAGQSTMINVLTGLLKPTQGSADIYGYDIRYNMDYIRSIMGVCPQFDILWDELTAEEHLIIYSKIKGVPENCIQREVDKRLQQVQLSHVQKARIGTFSGGMKRRVSMAISGIGNPKIIFMDEPTSGMDPKTRRSVWGMIKALKQNRVVILTTHAMEEADALSDRIIVIVDGFLQCIGTPLFLKNHFSDGYRLSLVCDPESVEKVRVTIKEILPSSKIADQSGGSVLVSVPVLHLGELRKFFNIMEEKIQDVDALQFKKLIKDWGLSHATLQEVFMQITRKNKTFQ